MEFKFYKPRKELAGLIKCIWSLECGSNNKASEERIIPSGCIEFYFYYNSKPIFFNDDDKLVSGSKACVSGQKIKFGKVSSTGKTGIFSVMLNPETAYSLLGLPANKISGQHVDLVDLWGAEGSELADKITGAANNEKRSDLIQDFLFGKLSVNSRRLEPRIKRTIDMINYSGGLVEVKTLTEAACLSRRQFERSFAEVVGLAPKQFARVVRLQKILSIKQNQNDISLTELALKSGYFDQSHFINDFKNMTGLTPKNYFNICPAFSDYYSFM